MTQQGEPREEFHLPITLTVGERQVEVPLVVSLTFAELAGIVRDHLENGADVYTSLLEKYAESVGGKAAKPARSAEKGARQRTRKTEAPHPAGK